MKIFGVGLPRSGGQTLQKALAHLLPGQVFHSPGKSWYKMGDDFAAAVEVFAPIQYLLNHWPDAKFILNVRDINPWLESCKAVYSKSGDWNNPLWFHPLDQFQAYHEAYISERLSYLASYFPHQAIIWDITRTPSWEPLCKLLDVPVPDVEFPNVDPVRRGIKPVIPQLAVQGSEPWRAGL